MLFKLAVRNVRRSIRQYLLYFVTLVLAIMVFYVFNAIETQQVILFLKQLEGDAVDRFLSILQYVSYAVSLVLGFLILYANQFQLRRRKKEMGIYSLMGMKKHSIAILLLGEGALLGFLALAAGLIAGTLLSQLLSVISSRFFEIELKSFQILFSPDAAVRTAVYFSIIQFAVILISVFSVSRRQIIDLLTASRKNESRASGRISTSIAKLAAGIVLLLVAYYLILQTTEISWYRNPSNLLVPVALGIAGTFLFFAGLSGALTVFPQKNPNSYYTGLNYFNIRQLSSKLSTVHRSVAMVCLLIFLTVSIMSIGISSAEQRLVTSKNENTYQVSLMGNFYDTTFPLQGKTKLAGDTYSSDLGFNLSDYTDEVIRMDLFSSIQGEIENYDALLDEAIASLSEAERDRWLDQSTYLKDHMSKYLRIIPLSQYNDLRSHQGLPALTLAAGHACYYRDPDFDDGNSIVTYLLSSGLQLDFQNRSFLIDPLIESVPLSTDHAITLAFGLIVPDEDIEAITPVHPNVTTLINFNFKPEGIEEQGLSSELALLNESVQMNKSPVEIFSSLQVQAREMVITVSISYICIYIGLIFLMCSAALLAIQQLTHLEENQQSFLTLSRLGATQKQLRRSVIRQVSTYFALPLGLALIDAVVAFLAINSYVQSKLSIPDLGLQTMYIGLLLVTVYGVYFLLTCISAVNAIERYTVSSYTK